MTDPALGRGRPLLELVAQAVQGGVTLVQLRDKAAAGRALLEAARALITRLAPQGVPLIVNDRVDVAVAAGAAGCHVGQSDLPAAAARALLGPEAILGVSLDTAEQAHGIDPAVVDYVAHGPFAATATKADAGAAVGAAGIARVRALRGLRRLPLVAIGGLDAGNLGAAVRAGADGIAVVSAIMAAADPAAASRELAAAIAAARQRA